MKTSEILLLISLICGTIYNVDNTLLRLLLILSWAFIPMIMLIKYNNQKVGLIGLKELNYSLLIILLLLISFFANLKTLSFELNGPNVEKLTPFLYFFHMTTVFYLFYFNNKKINKKFITYFMFSVLIVLILDMVVRYLQAPNYFMNYSTRHEAKTIGFFSTTNVNGQIIAFLLALSWQIKFQYKKIFQLLMLLVIITTMARSAIVALIIAYGLNYLIYNRGLLSKFISLLLVISIIVLFIVDPLNFRNDGSLLSKLEFFMATYNLIINGTIGDIIFGFGASYEAITLALDVNGWSPHVSILKAFLYYGILGVFIFIFTLIHFYYQNKKMLIPILTFLIFSLAGAPIFWPTLSVGLILLMIYENYNKVVRT